MNKLNITLANRAIPNRLKLNCNKLEINFDNCSFTHNSVILKIENKIVTRLFWVSDKQELDFTNEINKFNIEDKVFDIIVKVQDFDSKKSA